MGSVCRKHNEFFEAECRWCEPAAPPITVVRPRCTQISVNNTATCREAATWAWHGVSAEAVASEAALGAVYLCQEHHDKCDPAFYALNWRAERLP